MLRSMNDLTDYAVRAADGDMGHLKDFYFDDVTWTVLYLIVDTDARLSGRMMLISTMPIAHPYWAEKVLSVAISKKQAKGSPAIDAAKPVPQQYETGCLDYYGYAQYWYGIGLSSGVDDLGVAKLVEGDDSKQGSILATQTRAARRADDDNDSHLRSCKTVIGYRIQAVDGIIGNIRDMLVDEDTWVIRYLLVDTSNWWVLVAPENILNKSWPESMISVSLVRRAVKEAMPCDPACR